MELRIDGENMQVKVVATDIDGTLTDRSRKLNPSALQVVQNLSECVKVVLATGNTLCFTWACSVLLGTGGAVIAENGAVVASGYDSEPLILGDKERCLRVYPILVEKFSARALDIDYRLGEVVLERNFCISKAKRIVEQYDPELELVDTDFAIHVKLKHVSKARGLERLVSTFSASMDEVAAFGDSRNDISMLEKAGISLTVANAPSDVKDVCDYVSPYSFGEGFVDGVRWLVERGFIDDVVGLF